MPSSAKRICIAKILSPHGVRGAVNIHTYTEDPASLATYSPITDKEGKRTFEMRLKTIKGQRVIAAIDGVDTREAAGKLRHTLLYISRDLLPELEEDDFYIEDLVGIEVRVLPDEKVLGHVIGVYNHGGGDILEVQWLDGDKKKEQFAFTKAIFPEICLQEGYLMMERPEVEFVASEGEEG